MSEPSYTWNERARQYRDQQGRFVPRQTVRAALDHVLDAAVETIRTASQTLIDEPEAEGAVIGWQLEIERVIKLVNVAAAALAAGGRRNATAVQWASAARAIKAQYAYLRGFVAEINDGLPLDGAFVARAVMYALSGTGMYEALLRTADAVAGFLFERRIRHSRDSCAECREYEARGWQPIGTLPGIGQKCSCRTRCRCTFQRRRTMRGPVI